MKKADLKTGMLVETRDGCIYLIINDVLVDRDSFLNVKDYSEDLSFQPDSDINDSQYDIINVSRVVDSGYFSSDNWNKESLDDFLTWKREEPKPILTLDGVEYSKETLRSIIKKATS